MGSARLLHITDLHVTDTTQANVRRVLQALAETITEPVHQVLVTGDLAYRGSSEEYGLALNVLDELLTTLELTRNDVTIAPGNHDVNRKLIDEFMEEGYRHRIVSSAAANDVWGDTTKRHTALARQQPFFRFAAEAGFHGAPHVATIASLDVGFAPINSAWRSSDDGDKGRLFVSTAQVLEAYETVRDCDVRIALMHHPIAWLHEEEQDEIGGLLSSHFQVVVTGHRHSIESIQRSGPRENALYLTGRAIWDQHRPQGGNGAHVLSISVEEAGVRVEVEHFKYVSRHQKFVIDTEVSDNGKHSLTISTSPVRSSEEARLARQLQRDSAGVFAKAVRTLAPSISEHLPEFPIVPVFGSTNKDDGLLGLDDLLTDEASVLIYGSSLAGKTTTLLALQKRAKGLGKTALLVDTRLVENPRDTVGSLAKGMRISRSMAQRLLIARPTILLDDVELANPIHCELLGNLAKEGRKVIAAARENRLRELAALSRPPEVTAFKQIDLQPVPLTQIAQLGQQLEPLLGATSKGRLLRKLIVESFDAGLPRQPWIVLVFFELLVCNQVTAGLTLAQLLMRYTAHRLRTDAGNQLNLDVMTRALGWIAEGMVCRYKSELAYAEVLETVRAEILKADLPLEEGSVVTKLLESGLLIRNDEAIAFAFPAFQEFYYAVGLSARPRVDDIEIDVESLAQRGGAYALLAGLRDCTRLAHRVFELVRNVRPKGATVLDPAALRAIELTPLPAHDEELLDRMDETPPTLQDLDGETADRAQARIERRRDLLTKQSPPRTDVDRFFVVYMHSLAMLRNAAFLSKEDKKVFVSESIDNTIIFVNEMLARRDELLALLEGMGVSKDELDGDVFHAVTATLLVVIGSAVLAQLGAGQHLEHAIRRFCEDANEHSSRRIVGIAWYSYASGEQLEKVVDVFVKSRPAFADLLILQWWLSVEYLMQLAYSGERPSVVREALLCVSRAVALVAGQNKSGAEVSANEAVAKTEEKARQFKEKGKRD